MGANISARLEVQQPTSSGDEGDVFSGTLILVNKGKKSKRLDRAARVTLQLRVKCVTVTRATKKRPQTEANFFHEVWKVGGDLVKAQTVLAPGENTFSFSFPLDGKFRQELPQAEFWVTKFKESYTYVQYEYVVRGGSPPQINDVVIYPKHLLPANDDGFRGVNGITREEIRAWALRYM